MTRTNAMTTRAVLLALVLVAGCAGTPEAQTASLPGCWYFDQDEAGREIGLPWGVELLETPLTGWPNLAGQSGVAVARTLTADGPADTPFAYWRQVRADSIVVGYPLGGSLSLELRPENDALVGAARIIGDARTGATAPSPVPVRLTAARCP